MNSFAYRVYYLYGPSHSGSFRWPKDSPEISEALRHFPNELPHYLSDQAATVSAEPNKEDSNSIIVLVATVLDETATDEAVKQCNDQLVFFLDGDKAHVGPGDGFADGQHQLHRSCRACRTSAPPQSRIHPGYNDGWQAKHR